MNLFRAPSTAVTSASFAAARRDAENAMRRLVPGAADLCFVHLARRDAIVCVAAVHSTAAGERVARLFVRMYRLAVGDPHSAVAQVIRSGRAVLRTTIHPDAPPPGRRRDGRIAELHRQLAVRSALVVPLPVQPGGLAGALSLCYSDSGRRYARRDLHAAARAAARIARVLAPLGAPRASMATPPARRDMPPGTV